MEFEVNLYIFYDFPMFFQKYTTLLYPNFLNCSF